LKQKLRLFAIHQTLTSLQRNFGETTLSKVVVLVVIVIAATHAEFMNCFIWKQLEAVSALGTSSDERLKSLSSNGTKNKVYK
jgi:hypothetical protein